MTKLTPQVVKRAKRTTEFQRDSYGINVTAMRFVHVPSKTLPRHPAFMDTKLVVKGFDYGTRKSYRELAVQRILAIVAPNMAIPIVRNRGGEDNRGMDEVVLRWVKGKPEVTHKVTRTKQQEHEYGAMIMLDILSGMADRHNGNWVIGPVHLYPIDHESCHFYKLRELSEYDHRRIRNLEPEAMRGARWMASRIRDNARPVARWMEVARRSNGDLNGHDGRIRPEPYTAKEVKAWASKMFRDMLPYLYKYGGLEKPQRARQRVKIGGTREQGRKQQAP